MKQILVLIFIISIYTNSIIGQTRMIDPISCQVLKLELYKDSNRLSLATGFIVKHKNRNFLITNWHVVSGIDYYTGKYMDSLKREPNIIKIYYNSDTLGKWTIGSEKLKFVILKMWHETFVNKKLVDVIALPLYNVPDNAKIYYFDLDLDKTDMLVTVAGPTFIIGFPGGLTSYGNFPIWKTGHIASDPDLDVYKDLPTFFIDATTKPGMSGSPVLYRSFGTYRSKDGSNVINSAVVSKFLGIYSGQIDVLNIGVVFKPELIRKLLNEIR